MIGCRCQCLLALLIAGLVLTASVSVRAGQQGFAQRQSAQASTPEIPALPSAVQPNAPALLPSLSPVPETGSLGSPALVRKIQEALAARGYEPGPVDGVMGRRTQQAIVQFQTEAELPRDGMPSEALYEAIQAFLPPAGVPAAEAQPDSAVLPGPAPAADAELGHATQGPARVVDTGRLEVLGRILVLDGLWARGEPEQIEALAGYVAAQGGWVNCQPARPGRYRCVTQEGFDVGEVAILNGAAEASDDAPAHYHEAERKARERGAGIWP